MRQLASIKNELNAWGRELVVLSGNTERCSDYLSGIKRVTYGTDTDGKILKMIYDGCKPQSRRLPAVIIADSFGRVVYFSQGYNTSLAENIKAILPNL